MKVDPNKAKIYDKFSEVVVGDVIFTEGDGPCSGGARYGIGEVVTKITTKDIVVKDNRRYSRKDGGATNPPWAYYIEFWQKGGDTK